MTQSSMFFRRAALCVALGLVVTPVMAETVPTLAQKQELRRIARACRGDVKTYCSSLAQGEGRILMCLQDNGAVLRPKCQAMLPSAEALLIDLQAGSGG